MAFAPIAYTIPEYDRTLYANWWLKAYEQGTTTPKVMATDSTGGTTAAKFQLNAQGFPVTAGSALVIPYIDGAYDLWLFPTAAEADANDTSNALQFADNILAADTQLLATLGGLKGAYAFDEDTTATMTGNTVTTYEAGNVVRTKEFATGSGGGGLYDVVLTSSVTPNGRNIIQGVADATISFVLRDVEPIDIRAYGAASTVVDNSAIIQAVIDTGKSWVVPVTSSPFDIGVGLTSATENQEAKIDGVLRATAAIIMFEHTTSRYQRLTGSGRLDGNNIATYCHKISFPKCGLSGPECSKATVANVWMGHFSTFIDQNSRVITGDGIGVLIQDGVGQVNDIRVRDSIVSGNAQHGIRIATAARDGIWITGNNMENNCDTAGGFDHISSVAINSLHIENNYMENSLNTDANNSFMNIESGVETLTIKNNKMNDSASTTPFDYFLRLATTGGSILRRAVVSDNWADGYGSHFIENGLNTGVNNYLSLKNNNILSNTTDTLVSSGTAVDITEPVRTSLFAKRVSTNQTFSTATAAIFNEALESTTQSTVDIRLLPAAYSLTTGLYTVFESGRYNVSGIISVTAPASGVYFTVTIKRGGTIIYGPFYSQNGNGSKNVSCAFEGGVNCSPTDTLSVEITSSSGNLDMRVNASNLIIEKIGTNFGQQA